MAPKDNNKSSESSSSRRPPRTLFDFFKKKKKNTDKTNNATNNIEAVNNDSAEDKNKDDAGVTRHQSPARAAASHNRPETSRHRSTNTQSSSSTTRQKEDNPSHSSSSKTVVASGRPVDKKEIEKENHRNSPTKVKDSTTVEKSTVKEIAILEDSSITDNDDDDQQETTTQTRTKSRAAVDLNRSNGDDDVDDDDDDELVQPSRKKQRKRRILDDDSSEEENEDTENDKASKQPGPKSDDAPSVVAQKKDAGDKGGAGKKRDSAASQQWAFLDGKGEAPPKKKQKTKAPAKQKSKKKDSKSEDGHDVRTVLKNPYTAGDDLPVISDPQKMFDDMIRNKLTDNGKKVEILLPLLKVLKNRTLRVATMCSGTESPILALDMLQKAIRDVCSDYMSKELKEFGIELDHVLQVEHVFSCEIEPFKQAYIERNFHPPLLFRDIRELGQDKAFTAYGSSVNVPNTPGCVDLLIAGTSCVDYSNLNNKKKALEEAGESGQTFKGMMKWIEKAQPPLVIIENVFGAPWAKKVELFEELGYSASFVRVDTKDYYIPQTRNRGYLFAVKCEAPKKVKREQWPKEWSQLVKELKRPASAALDAFMLPNDDPRVLRGRARLTAESCSGDGQGGGERAGRTDWTKCETRHQYARSSEELGDQRPLTGWSDSGNTVMPNFAWNDWTNAQVHRIHDLMDINTLRMAQVGLDCTHKTMVWNLSQNVDRDTMGKLGLCQCLTPTGVPYVSSRGGPLVGEELLLLQGIPADDLLLTKETEDNLKDLAGNAMSTTVVGASILCALVFGYKALESNAAGRSEGSVGAILSSLVPRPLLPVSNVTIHQALLGVYEEKDLDLGPRTVGGLDAWRSFLANASSSARMCATEGPEDAYSVDSLVVCRECGHTSSEKAACPPRKFEEHDFKRMNEVAPRMQPSEFRSILLDMLPMRVHLVDFDLDGLKRPEETDQQLWNQWKEYVRKAVTSPKDEGPAVFRLTEVVRSHFWVARYCSQEHARLEFQISKRGLRWLLFCDKPPIKGPLRDLLERPVARMEVSLPTESTVSATFLDGQWELNLPAMCSVKLKIEGVGERVSSWRSRLGLKGQFERETQYEILKVSVETEEHAKLKAEIDGHYKLLPKCGGACGSLRRKVNLSSEEESGEMFFFLESGRKSLPKDDAYIFSRTCHRTAYGEYRDICLQIDPKLEYRPVVASGDESENYVETVLAIIPGQWVEAEGAELECFTGRNQAQRMKLTCPKAGSTLKLPICTDAWKNCPEIVSCTVPMEPDDNIVVQCQKHGGAVDINIQKSQCVFQEIAFVLSRFSIPEIFDDKQWLSFDYERMNLVNGEEEVCRICAPAKPEIIWKVVTKGKKAMFLPIEDGQEAAVYERALKHRPAPWMIRFSLSTASTVNMQIGCNAVSLVQRALRLFPVSSLPRRSMIDLAARKQSPSSSRSMFEWRIVPHVEKAKGDFPSLKFTSNKKDSEADQPPNFTKYKLRREQLRSLTWMLKQESTTDGYLEEEVAEAILPNLRWRAEARVRRPVLARGGIIADEVGYGKTAITLGLIDAAAKINGSPPLPPDDYRSGFVYTKATLVVVPGHLMSQWPGEIKKFLGDKKVVRVIKDMNCFNKLTIEDVQKADIIVVNFTALCGAKYFSRLARLSGVDPNSLPAGKSGGRRFRAVYNECLVSLAERVSEMFNDSSRVFESVSGTAKANSRARVEESVRLDGKKTVYKNGDAKASAKCGRTKTDASESDPWKLSSAEVKRDLCKMKCPPLEMFFFNRIVVDEFTYLFEKERDRVLALVQCLKSSHRWCLSGTPRHDNFNDIQVLASLLGVHLGVDEVLPGNKRSKKERSNQETTGLESLSHYLEVRSMQWHERRHAIAQSFLDRFVRQNIAEIDEIPSEDHQKAITLPPAERAIYLELETHLKSLEMNSKMAQRSKKKSTGDRESRMQKALQESSTGEEALLKCCCHFNMSSSETATALQTIDDIMKLRESQKREVEQELATSLAAAFRQRRRILAHQPNWTGTTKNEKGEVRDELQQYLKAVEKMDSVTHGADEEIHLRIQQIVQNAQSIFEESPDEDDGVFAETASGGNVNDEDSLQSAFFMKQALRNHMHCIRSLGKELCGRMRSLRYAQWISRFQRKRTGFECSRCEKTELNVGQVGVLSSCGHVGCLICLEEHALDGKCAEPNCSARVSSAHIVAANDLGLNSEDISGGRFGRKLTTIVNKTKDIVASGDRVIIFCQFDDLQETIFEALGESGVLALRVKGSVQQQTKALSVMQKDKPGKNDPRVLLLKMDDEQSAGLNLTNLNHAIFVHPLLAGSQQEYDAYETQAIGRIRRFGQTKTVYVWRFLAMDTIDTEIFQKRSGGPLDAATNTVQHHQSE